MEDRTRCEHKRCDRLVSTECSKCWRRICQKHSEVVSDERICFMCLEEQKRAVEETRKAMKGKEDSRDDES